MTPPARGRDAVTLGLLLAAGGAVLEALVLRKAVGDASSTPLEWGFFSMISALMIVAGAALGASRVAVADGMLTVRNGLRTRRVACTDIARIDVPGAAPGAVRGDGDSSWPVRRTRTAVPTLVLSDGREIGVFAYMMEPSLRRQGMGRDDLEGLVTQLRAAVSPQNDIGESRLIG